MKIVASTFAVMFLAAGAVAANAQTNNGAKSSPSEVMTKPPTVADSPAGGPKLTGCGTVASKEEKGKQGSVANSSSHNASTTGTNAAGKLKTGC